MMNPRLQDTLRALEVEPGLPVIRVPDIPERILASYSDEVVPDMYSECKMLEFKRHEFTIDARRFEPKFRAKFFIFWQGWITSEAGFNSKLQYIGPWTQHSGEMNIVRYAIYIQTVEHLFTLVDNVNRIRDRILKEQHDSHS